jgi:hypothetical protein
VVYGHLMGVQPEEDALHPVHPAAQPAIEQHRQDSMGGTVRIGEQIDAGLGGMASSVET